MSTLILIIALATFGVLKSLMRMLSSIERILSITKNFT